MRRLRTRALLASAASRVIALHRITITSPLTRCNLHSRCAHSVTALLTVNAAAVTPSALPAASLSPPLDLDTSSPAVPSPSPSASSAFYTLALDINTQNIGYALLSPSLQLLQAGVITVSRESSVPERLSQVRSALQSVLACLPSPLPLPVYPAVEDYMRSFSPSRFHLRSLFSLAEWNSLVCHLLYSATGRWPLRLHPTAARSQFGLKRRSAAGGVSDVKQVVWEWVDARLSAEAAKLQWRRKRSGALHASQYDISDAYVIAITAAAQFTQSRGSDQQTESESAQQAADTERKKQVKVKAKQRTKAKELSATSVVPAAPPKLRRVRRQAAAAD